MILTPTVLVLGAGASKAYGYPLGGELKGLILEITKPGGAVWGLVGNPEESVRPFHEAFSTSPCGTIDEFLESEQGHYVIGKLSIAAALSAFSPPAGFAADPSQDWYGELWQQLVTGADTIEKFWRNRVRIITYNYDRSLERYFMARFAQHYSEDLPSAGTHFTNAVAIAHVHGALEDDLQLVMVAPDSSHLLKSRILLEMTERFSTMRHTHPFRYVNAHQWLQEAEAVHILGFGFHAWNLAQLNIESHVGHSGRCKVLGGTALGLSSEARLLATRMSPTPALYETDCLAYLRKHANLK